MKKNNWILAVTIVIVFLILGIIIFGKSKDNKKIVTSNKSIPVPTPTPIKYTLPSSDFSGLRQTLTPKGKIREIVGRVISYNKDISKIKIGDEAIPFVYELNISTREAFIVDEVTVSEKGYAVYTKSDDSNIVPGKTKIIADCPEEKVDPGCQTINKVHIITIE